MGQRARRLQREPGKTPLAPRQHDPFHSSPRSRACAGLTAILPSRKLQNRTMRGCASGARSLQCKWCIAGRRSATPMLLLLTRGKKYWGFLEGKQVFSTLVSGYRGMVVRLFTPQHSLPRNR